MDIAEIADPYDITRYIVFHRKLNPKLWKHHELRLDVRAHLLRIALEFYDFLEVPRLAVRDVIFTGSNAAFNYTPLSDVDIHIIVDFAHTACPGLADNFFTTKKNLWNATRQIAIRGFNVELYVEDVTNPVQANGIYSLLHGWVKEPVRQRPKYDDLSVVSKTEQYAERIDDLLNSHADIDAINTLRQQLHTLRQAGLHAGGEYSVENLTFKSLRNLGYLEKLSQARQHALDAEMSLA